MTEDEVYEKLCAKCLCEAECHEDMDFCDAYLMALDGEEYDGNDKRDLCQYDCKMDYEVDRAVMG